MSDCALRYCKCSSFAPCSRGHAPKQKIEAENKEMASEEEPVPTPEARSRGRPKGSKDSKPRASRRAKQEVQDTEEAGAEADTEPVPSEEPVSEEPVSEEPASAAPASEEPASAAPAPRAAPRRAREEVTPVAKPRRSARTPPRKAHARERTPSPPLSYLEVLNRTMAAARHAERTERSARYDALFAAMR